MNIRAKIFGTQDPAEEVPVLGTKRPKGVKADVLNKSTGVTTTDTVTDSGIGMKYGLTSTMTFDFTYNPDFSQIESDKQQIEVNQLRFSKDLRIQGFLKERRHPCRDRQ